MATTVSCAACGETGETLKLCSACKAVGYCDARCQKKHRKKHSNKCSQMALRLKTQEATARLESLCDSVPDDLDDPHSELWKPPLRPECPICTLTLPVKSGESHYKMCCGNGLCGGCVLKNKVTIMENKESGRASAPLEESCAFCREVPPSGPEEELKRMQKRMELNDSNAFLLMAQCRSDGEGVPKDEWKGFEYLVRATELGCVNAYCCLANHHRDGKFVAVDRRKEKVFLQLAVMGGSNYARHKLGLFELQNGNKDLAVRHWQIAAGAGKEESLNEIKEAYKQGFASKDVFAEALRAYQAAQGELKSEERDRYSAFVRHQGK